MQPEYCTARQGRVNILLSRLAPHTVTHTYKHPSYTVLQSCFMHTRNNVPVRVPKLKTNKQTNKNNTSVTPQLMTIFCC